ncbi:MAG TPA: filamentous hemagglutinin N-terminal domain-containing protein, partial [Rhodospirillaceae bacterium]|nr:filamentous hemagglutinin N-terminal domain-containing protein [Rhodospirillaceae bacterium]
MKLRHFFPVSTAAAAILWGGPGLANPQAPQVVSGGVTFSQSGNRLTVTETTPQAVVNWRSFSVGTGEILQFVQPSATATLLNRVTGGQASQIDGQLLAGGHLFLLNPNGIAVGSSGFIHAAGLLMTSSALANEDYLAGRHRFTAVPGQGGISNAGTIQADNGGTVVLSAPQVTNSGGIAAPGGGVQLGAADGFAVDPAGDGLWAYHITQPAAAALLANHGTVSADGGQVAFTARALDGAQREVINTDGLVQANTVGVRKGIVTLDGGDPGRLDSGGVTIGGEVSARGQAAGESGGTIIVHGGRVALTDGARLIAAAGLTGDGGLIETSGAGLTVGKAVVDPGAAHGKPGRWRLDPNDLTIDGATAATVGNTLKTADVELATDATGSGGNGDIVVNAPVTWSSGQTLTLTAQRNIAINAPITASGAGAGLVLNYAQGGAGGTDVTAAGASVTLSGAEPLLKLCNGTGCVLPTLINSAAGLKGLDPTGTYALVGDVDMSGVGGFAALGGATGFSGSIDGLGHSIANLTASGNGLIGSLGGTVQNLALSNANLTATGSNTGLLAGSTAAGAVIANSSSTGSLSGGSFANIGGLVGNNAGTIADSYSSATVRGGASVGGLVGQQQGGTVIRSFALGPVRASAQMAGGLVGNNLGTVTDSYATGGASGAGEVGSLIGFNQGAVQSSYAAGGGALTGGSGGSATTSKLFALADILDPSQLSAAWTAGPNGAPILANRQTYLSITAQDASATYGAALPAFQNTVSDATATVSGVTYTTDGGATPGTGSHAITPGGATAVSAIGYPVTNIVYQPGTLTVGQAKLTVTANDATRFYGGDNPAFTVSYSGFVNGDSAGSLPTQPSATSAATRGTGIGITPITASGPTTDGNYAVTYANGKLTINPAPLTVTVDPASRPYGADNPAFTLHYSGFLNGDGASLLSTLPTAASTATATTGAGVYPVTVTGPATDANYQMTYVGGSLTISKLPLTWSVTSSSATYGTTPVLGVATLSGLVNGDQVTASVGAVGGGAPLTLSAATPAGSYSQIVTGMAGDNGNYVLAADGNSPGKLTVNPAPLTIRADNA